MCLAVPGKILEIIDAGQLTCRGPVSFGGIVREVNFAYVPEARPSDYVLVHVGFAISVIDENEAGKIFALLGELEQSAE